jgi:hypothetical protein
MRVPRGPTCIPQFLRSGVRAIEITTNPAINFSSTFSFSGVPSITLLSASHTSAFQTLQTHPGKAIVQQLHTSNCTDYIQLPCRSTLN